MRSRLLLRRASPLTSSANASCLAALAHQLQDLDRRVVVVQHVALCRLPDQFLEGRFERSACASTMSHWVEAGRGTPRSPCRFSAG